MATAQEVAAVLQFQKFCFVKTNLLTKNRFQTMLRHLTMKATFTVALLYMFAARRALDNILGYEPRDENLTPDIVHFHQNYPTFNPAVTLEPEPWHIILGKKKKITVDNIQAWYTGTRFVARKAREETPYVAETHYHYGEFPISSIVSGGPGVPYKRDDKLIWPADREPYAECFLRQTYYNPRTLSDELPHFLQQLLRCYSWWKLNPHQKPKLTMKKKIKRKGYMAVIHQYVKAMENVFGVQRESFNEKATGYVVVEAPWEQMSQFNETYAMNSEHAKEMVSAMLDNSLPNEPRGGCQANQEPSIAFLNREGSRRTLGNHREVLAEIEKAGYEVFYKENFDNMSLKDQMKFMSKYDIVMGPHGAQFSNTIFQPECGSLIEFFPREYYTPNFFGSLAALSGKHHFFTYPGGRTVQASIKMRSVPSYNTTPAVVAELTHKAVERWHSCCKNGFRADIPKKNQTN